MIYDKTRVNEPGYYELFEMTYKPALEKDRKDAERYRFIRAAPESDVLLCQDQPAGYNGSFYMSLDLAWKAKRWEKYTPEHLDAAIDEAMRTTEPLLVAPPVTKGKAESSWYRRTNEQQEELRVHKERLNQVADDYDLTSNDTRRGD